MAKISEMAALAQEKKVKNISELPSFSTKSLDMETATRQRQDGEEYEVNITVVDGVEYRIPHTVLMQIKTLQENNPKIDYVKVVRKGQGKEGTTYTVVPVDGPKK